MRMFGETQRVAMRLGAVMFLISVPILLVVGLVAGAALVSDEKIIQVPDGQSEFELPDPGLFGKDTTIYGAVTTPERPDPKELGCRLVNKNGHAYNSAHLNWLFALARPEVTVDGIDLAPLFEVSYAKGDRVQCDHLDQVRPVGYSAPSTFGSGSGSIVMLTLPGALTTLVMGLGGFFYFAPRGPAVAGRWF